MSSQSASSRKSWFDVSPDTSTISVDPGEIAAKALKGKVVSGGSAASVSAAGQPVSGSLKYADACAYRAGDEMSAVMPQSIAAMTRRSKPDQMDPRCRDAIPIAAMVLMFETSMPFDTK